MAAAFLPRHPPAFLRLLRARGLGTRQPRVERHEDHAADATCADALAILRRCAALLAEDGIDSAAALPDARQAARLAFTPSPIRAPPSPGRATEAARWCDARCAWLRAHHAAHLYAACIGHADAWLADGAYIALARRQGVRVRSPCAQASLWATRAHGMELRLGLHLVRGLARAEAEAIVRERARGSFAGVRQLKARCRLGPAALRALDVAGALDAVAPLANARQRAFLVERAGAEPDAFIACASEGGERLLAALALEERDPPAPPMRGGDAAAERSCRWRALGCLTASWTRWRAEAHAPRLADLHRAASGAAAPLVVRCASRQVDGPCIALEDETALVESWWEPALAAERAALLSANEPFLAMGRLTASRGSRALAITAAQPLASGSDCSGG